MREEFPNDPVTEHPLSEELQKESRTWDQPPTRPAEPVPAKPAADRPLAVRYDLD